MVTISVLIIEDSEDDVALIRRHLERAGYDVHYERVDTAEAVVRAIQRGGWDVVISDFSMPKFSGADALALLREHDPNTPFVFVSGTIGEDVAVEAMRAGAQDYVIKSNLRRLAPVIERELRETAVRRERNAAQTRLRRVVDSSMTGMFFWDLSGTVTEVNDEFLRIVGYSREDLAQGRVNWRAMTPPEYAGADARALEEVATRGFCAPYEKEYLRKDGTRVPILIGGASVSDDGAGVAFILDMTERKRTSDELRQSDERYRQLFEWHPQPLWLFDRDSLRFIAVNEAAVRQYGYSHEEFLTMSIEDIRPAEDVPLARQIARTPGFDMSGRHWRHITKDGRQLDVEVAAHDVEFAGRPARLVAVLDITERERARRALEARARQQAAVALLGEQAVTTPELPVLFQTACVLVAETLAVSFTKVLELQDDDATLLMRAGVGWREGAVGTATMVVQANNRSGFVLRHGSPTVVEDIRTERRFAHDPLLRDHGVVSGVSVVIPAGGRVFGLLGADADTQRAFTQDDVHFLQAVAHILGSAIDRHRADRALQQTQRLESVGRLAGGIAHDFNNVLTVISSYAELLRSDLAPEDARAEDCDEIIGAVQRAQGLTRQLLAFSRQQVVQTVVLDLRTVIRGVEKLLRRAIGETIEVVLRFDGAPAHVRADAGQLEQVLINLAVNARDAMPEGGRLIIETSQLAADEPAARQHGLPAPGPYICLTVRDTGTGIPPEILSRVFEPFFTTKDLVRGTGLGLATVYGIVRQAGGNVMVNSVVGEGTTFEILLPVVNEPLSATEAPGVARPKSGTETILLCEDDTAVRNAVAEILARHGYTVLTARSGDDAVSTAAARSGAIQLLVTDVVLPGGDGQSVAQRLRATRPDLKVLFVSGYAPEAVQRQALAESSATFLAKPFTSAEFLNRVREILDSG